jgi:hypothetical protein
MKRFLLMAGMVLFLTAGQASATILYTFSGVTFTGGGTLSGTFTTNDAINTLISFDITTSAGPGIGFHYTPATAGSSSSSLPFIIVLSTPTLDHILQVSFSSLTALGGPIKIGTFDSFEQGTGVPAARRDIAAGSAIIATTVPEPSTIFLLGMGALGLLASVRRRRG